MTSCAGRFAEHGDFRITDVDTVLTTTRAVRRRLDLDRPVPLELLVECLDIALQAPTGADSEDWRFVVMGDPDVKGAVGQEYRRVFDREVCPRLPSLVDRSHEPAERREREAGQGETDQELADRRRKARVYSGAEYLADNLGRVPWLVLACATRPPPTPELAASLYGSVFPAVWSFQLALRSRGLGSIITTLHLRDPAGVARVLGVPDGVTQCALLPVAYTIGTDFRPAERKPASQVSFLERWGRPMDGG